MNQKELKALYTAELTKAWGTDEMVNYCSKHTAYVVEHNGDLFGIEKPSIKKNFCFGAGMYATATNEEILHAEEQSEKALNDTEYFISRNTEHLDKIIENLKKVLADMGLNWAKGSHPIHMVQTGAQYIGQPDDCKLRYHNIVNTFDNRQFREEAKETLCYDPELVKKLIEGYEATKADFMKRLNVYLKKYGLSKVNSWTYIRD